MPTWYVLVCLLYDKRKLACISIFSQGCRNVVDRSKWLPGVSRHQLFCWYSYTVCVHKCAITGQKVLCHMTASSSCSSILVCFSTWHLRTAVKVTAFSTRTAGLCHYYFLFAVGFGLFFGKFMALLIKSSPPDKPGELAGLRSSTVVHVDIVRPSSWRQTASSLAGGAREENWATNISQNMVGSHSFVCSIMDLLYHVMWWGILIVVRTNYHALKHTNGCRLS